MRSHNWISIAELSRQLISPGSWIGYTTQRRGERVKRNLSWAQVKARASSRQDSFTLATTSGLHLFSNHYETSSVYGSFEIPSRIWAIMKFKATLSQKLLQMLPSAKTNTRNATSPLTVLHSTASTCDIASIFGMRFRMPHSTADYHIFCSVCALYNSLR